MTLLEIKAALSDFDAFWLTLWAETRGEPIEGQIGVACVIRNRVAFDIGQDGKPDWWGEGYRGVCLAPAQFSCWNEGTEANHLAVVKLARLVLGDYVDRSLLPNDPIVRQLKAVVECVMNGAFQDRVKGATHYLTTALYSSPKRPRWAMGPPLMLGSHVFVKAA